MENILDVSKFIEAHSLPQEVYIIDNMRFELLGLTQALKAELKGVDGYESILEFAAECGVSVGYNRAIDSEAFKKGLDGVWALAEIQSNEAGFIKKSVGEKVCELSGLASYIDDVNQKEIEAEIEAERLKSQDDGIESPTDEQMAADRLAAGLPA